MNIDSFFSSFLREPKLWSNAGRTVVRSYSSTQKAPATAHSQTKCVQPTVKEPDSLPHTNTHTHKPCVVRAIQLTIHSYYIRYPHNGIGSNEKCAILFIPSHSIRHLCTCQFHSPIHSHTSTHSLARSFSLRLPCLVSQPWRTTCEA